MRILVFIGLKFVEILGLVALIGIMVGMVWLLEEKVDWGSLTGRILKVVGWGFLILIVGAVLVSWGDDNWKWAGRIVGD